LIALMLAVAGLVLLAVLWLLFRSRIRVRHDQASRIYLRMCKRLEKEGFVRGGAEGPIQFARRIAAQQPRWKIHMLAATRAYVALSYEPVSSDQRRSLLKLLRTEAGKVA
jgi:hypothetical protein